MIFKVLNLFLTGKIKHFFVVTKCVSRELSSTAFHILFFGICKFRLALFFFKGLQTAALIPHNWPNYIFNILVKIKNPSSIKTLLFSEAKTI
jgi:hypothetical protein